MSEVFSNTNNIDILDGDAANPYPSNIDVSGLNGTVNSVDVTLNNINHTFPNDVDIMLVAPTGESIMLMSDVGGSFDLNNVTLTFDQDASNGMPSYYDSQEITSGTYLPTDSDYDPDGNYYQDYFPSPAPEATDNTDLSVFNGLDPNGSWSLYVVDQYGADTGNIADGWQLEFDVSPSVNIIDGDNFHNLLNGTSGDDVINGLAGKDTLNGLEGNDTLNGGTGNDILNGGLGNDTYLVDNVGDVVTETSALSTEIDTVQSSVSYSLGLRVENLTLTGLSVNGTGNALNNVIIGSDSSNNLDGLAGNDTVYGGLGNDNIKGGNQNDVLFGQAGDDQLDGGVGVDTMEGGDGKDTYIVNSSFDVVNETSVAAEVDTVQSGVIYTLGANLENLVLTGSSPLKGVGNELNNSIQGNNANNVIEGKLGNDNLKGNGGNDILTGAAGNDILAGGSGLDQFRYVSGSAFNTSDFGLDHISDFVTGQDKIVLSKTAFNTLSATPGHSLTNVDFAIVTSDAQAKLSSSSMVYNSSNGRLFYNQNGAASGLGTGAQIALLDGIPAVAATDFSVIV